MRTYDWRWIPRRLGSLVVTLLLVTFLTSLLLELLPGNKAATILGPAATPEQIKIVEENLKLDEPFVVRFGTWVARAVTGDLGVSRNGELVSQALVVKLPQSMLILIATQIAAAGLALSAAAYTAQRPNGRADRLGSAIAFGAIALPQFVLALGLLVFFVGRWNVFPSFPPNLSEDPLGNLWGIVPAVVSLAFPLSGIYYRVLRTDLGQTMQSDFITRARASGLSRRRVLWSHALRPSSLTLVSVMGLNSAALLGGTIAVERLFNINGLGNYLLLSVLDRDFVKVQGAVLVIALVYIITQFVVDILLQVFDPRVRAAVAGHVV